MQVPGLSPDMFKAVHYEAHTVNEWMFGILIKCLFMFYVLFCFLCVSVVSVGDALGWGANGDLMSSCLAGHF